MEMWKYDDICAMTWHNDVMIQHQAKGIKFNQVYTR